MIPSPPMLTFATRFARRWRQSLGTSQLDDHLREDIGLPPREPPPPLFRRYGY